MSNPNPIVVSAAPVAASQNIVVQARPAPAFQANAFFNPSFQTSSHSSIAFQQCAFSHTAFQTDECRNDGRSGYWRLFFTQMQEEALKEYEKKTESGTDTGAVESAPVETKKAPAKKKPKRVEPEIVDQPEPIELPKFRRKPIYRTPNTYDELANLPNIETLYQSVVSIRNALIIDLEQQRVQRRKQTRRRVAALLLLAA